MSYAISIINGKDENNYTENEATCIRQELHKAGFTLAPVQGYVMPDGVQVSDASIVLADYNDAMSLGQAFKQYSIWDYEESKIVIVPEKTAYEGNALMSSVIDLCNDCIIAGQLRSNEYSHMGACGTYEAKGLRYLKPAYPTSIVANMMH